MKTAIVRAASRALILYNDPTGIRAWRLAMDRREASERLRVTEFLCHAIVNGLEEGAEHAARRILEPSFGPMSDYQLRRFAPSYTYIRNFLRREYDADYVLACQMAHKRVAMRNRRWSYSRAEDRCGAEPGWL